MRIIRRLVRWTLVAIAAVTILALAGAILLRTPWGLERTRRLMESRASGLFDADLRVGRLSGSVFGDIVMTDVTISRGGEALIRADAIRVRYRPLDFLRRRFIVNDVVLTRPSILAIERDDGWNLAKLAKPRAPGGKPVTFAIRRIEVIDGTLRLQPKRAAPRQLQHLALETGLDYRDREWRFDIQRGSAVDATAGVPLRTLRAKLLFGPRFVVDDLELATDRTHLSGSVTVTSERGAREIDAAIDAAPVALDELRRYLPGLPASTLVPSIRVTAKGPLTALGGSWTIDSTAGRTSGTFETSGVDRIERVEGRAEVARLDLAPWFARPGLASRLTGQATFVVSDLRASTPLVSFTFDGRDLAIAGYDARRMFTRGTYRGGVVNATARGEAYGAAVEASALRWRLGQRDFQSTGRFARLNLAALPPIFRMPRLLSDLAGQYDVTVSPDTWSADATFDASVLEGARIAAGTVGHAEDTTGEVAYRAKGRVDDLDLVRLARAWPELPRTLEKLPGRINAGFDVDGQAFALDTATLRGTVHAEQTTIADLRLPELDATVALERRRLVVDLRGAIDRVEGPRLGIPEGEGLGASVRPDLHVVIPDVGAPWAIDAVEATGSVVLEDLTYRGVRADRVAWNGALRSGVVEVKTLEITGPDLTATASGRVDLAGEESSDLRYLIDLASLSALQSLTTQPLRGTVRVEGRLQGAGSLLETTASVRGHDLAAGALQALTLESTVDAKVTDRQWTAVVAKAKSVASFVQAGNARVDRVTSTVGYDGGEMDIEARLESRARTLEIAGLLTPHPDHQEVHLRQLALASGGVAWALPAGGDATIQYGANRIAVTGLDLVRGDAIVRVAGTIGDGATPATPLVIRAERVDIADFNELLLESERLTGRLDATIEFAGPLASPRAAAKAVVVNGSIDGIAFDRLAGSVDYVPGAIGLDIALEAGASGRLTAIGTMPVGTASDGTARPYDLRLTSPGVNLGLAQPLTPGMTGLSGTGRFDLHVSGTSDAPVLKGSAAIEAGAFTVPYTGMTYRNVNGAFTVVDRALTVDKFTLEDEDKHVLSVSGKFNVAGGGKPSAFDLYFSGEELHVLHNKMGDVAITVDLHARGDLETPLVFGTVEVAHATVEVDDVIDRLRSTGYVPLAADELLDHRDTLAPGGLGRGSYSVTLSLPDTVVLRGRNLRPTDGPIGLGAINITVGGALSISKNPDEPTDVRGELDVIRGQYEFQGRKFAIVRGSHLSFLGDTVLDPTLNVSAERNISGVTARVRVTGTARRPEIQLSSTPGLDESDILSLIIFNEPANQLLASQRVSLAATAGTLAARAVATPLADSVARALNLDLFEIGPSEDVAGGATITIGQRIGDRLFVGFRHDFGAAEISQVSFEYKLSEFLRIVSTFADNPNLSYSVPRAERAGLDIFYVIRRDP
jgi:hypothetical protein